MGMGGNDEKSACSTQRIWWFPEDRLMS
jgi:hypothetical protein